MNWSIWITGPPGSGKTTLARGVAAALEARGVTLKVLELDEVRKVVTPAPTYSETERDIGAGKTRQDPRKTHTLRQPCQRRQRAGPGERPRSREVANAVVE